MITSSLTSHQGSSDTAERDVDPNNTPATSTPRPRLLARLRRMTAHVTVLLALTTLGVGAMTSQADAALNLSGVTFSLDSAYCNPNVAAPRGISVHASNDSSYGASFRLVLQQTSGGAYVYGRWHGFNGGSGGYGTTFGINDFNFGAHATYRVWVQYAQLLNNGQYTYGTEEIVRFAEARWAPYVGSTWQRYCTI